MMDIKEALDFLAGNCPTVFEPISAEITRLKERDKATNEKLDLTQDALNDLIFNTLNGGN